MEEPKPEDQKPDDKYLEMMTDIDPTLVYTMTSTPTTKHREKGEMGIKQHCTCKKKCTEECECVKNSGLRYSDSRVLEHLEQRPAFECNYLCKCPANCGYRVVSRGPHPTLEIKLTDKKGYGVFTTTKVPKGGFVCEYAGELVTPIEAEQRSRQYRKMNICNYIYWLREHILDAPTIEKNVTQRDVVTIVDPTHVGNIGRFINHSCVPNCYIIPIRIDSVHPRLCLFASQQITKGEEITFDYGMDERGKRRMEHEEPPDGMQRILCHCNKFTCRKYLPYHGY